MFFLVLRLNNNYIKAVISSTGWSGQPC